MDSNLSSLLAGIAATVAVGAHGIVGGRWFTAQLRAAALGPSRLFGDADVSWRVFAVTWHVVTATFVVCAAALYLTAAGALESRDLLRFIAILHLAFLGVGCLYMGRRPDAFLRPIPPVFVSVMASTAVFAWLASSSL